MHEAFQAVVKLEQAVQFDRFVTGVLAIVAVGAPGHTADVVFAGKAPVASLFFSPGTDFPLGDARIDGMPLCSMRRREISFSQK